MESHDQNARVITKSVKIAQQVGTKRLRRITACVRILRPIHLPRGNRKISMVKESSSRQFKARCATARQLPTAQRLVRKGKQNFKFMCAGSRPFGSAGPIAWNALPPSLLTKTLYLLSNSSSQTISVAGRLSDQPAESPQGSAHATQELSSAKNLLQLVQLLWNFFYL